MDEIQNNTNEPEVIEAPVEAEPVLGDMLQHEPTPEPKAETVGLDKFLDIKKQNKELKREMDKMKSQIENGVDVSGDLESIADEYGVDKGFLQKLKNVDRSEMNEEIQRLVAEKLKPLEQAQKAKESEKKFEAMFNQTLERMPEYANIVDRDSVKLLAFQKENETLSMPQLMEKMYGKSIGGRKTIETTTPRGGKDPQEIDYSLAKRDTTYFAEIMSDPALKAKYNQNIEGRLDL